MRMMENTFALRHNRGCAKISEDMVSLRYECDSDTESVKRKVRGRGCKVLGDVINKAESNKDAATKADLTEERGKLRVEIANVKADIIKWMFLFWIGQTAVMVALFKFFVK
ncbi:MAG: hypothetical protein HQK96_09620 [Nitrospirae bacterium]|nr:hypothetical protein [Nitrospirota bacterium]